MAKINLNSLATQALANVADLTDAKVGECLTGIVTNLTGVRSDKPLTRLYVRCNDGLNFTGLIDGHPIANLVIKGHEVTLQFTGVKTVNGVAYANFRVLL